MALPTSEVMDVADQNLALGYVPFDLFPDVEQTIIENSGKSPLAWSADRNGKSKFWIDKEQVMKATDSVGNITYAFQLRKNKMSRKRMYNLIVSKRLDGKKVAPFVIKYKFKKGDKFSYAENPDKVFDGKVDIISLRQFANTHRLTSKSDSAPCPTLDDLGPRDRTRDTSTDGSSGGSGGHSESFGPAPSPSFSVGRAHISINASYRGGGIVYGGVGTFTTSVCEDCQTKKSATRNGKTDGDCPDQNLLVPVNAPAARIGNKIDNPCAAEIVDKANSAKN